MNLSEKIEILESEKIKSRILMQGGFCCMIPLGTVILSFAINKNYFQSEFYLLGFIISLLFFVIGYKMVLLSYHKGKYWEDLFLSWIGSK